MRRQDIDQAPQDCRGVTDERDRRSLAALRLLRVGIDTDDGKLVVRTPLMESEEQPRPERENRVGFAPEVMTDRERDAERIAGIKHTAAAAKGHDRRLQ